MKYEIPFILKGLSHIFLKCGKTLIFLGYSLNVRSSEYNESNVDCENETSQRLSNIFDNLTIKYSLKNKINKQKMKLNKNR